MDEIRIPFERVLVTGGSGRIGRHVVDALSGRCQVTVLDIAPPVSGVRHVPGDVLDLGAVAGAMAGQDAVIHLAALLASGGQASEAVFHTNVQGSWNVLHAAESAGLRKAVLCSSECVTGVVFADRKSPPRYLPVDESHPCRPVETYGLSKLAAELVGQGFARRGRMEIVVLRPVWVATPDLQHQIAARGSDPGHRDLWGYVEPADVASAFRHALALKDITYDCFFISAADTLSPTPTLELIENFYGKLPEVRTPELYESNPHAAIFDIGRARRLLGYAPESDWRRLLAELT